jgi:hypothetical protein
MISKTSFSPFQLSGPARSNFRASFVLPKPAATDASRGNYRI